MAFKKTIHVYDYDYSGVVPNASLSDISYRLPVHASEGYGVSEYKDNENAGLDWIWPPANVQIGKGYDIQKREIALVLDSKTQREYQINDLDVWKDRAGTYEGNTIKSEVHQRAVFSDEGEHVPIRHVEHHEYFKSFDRKNMQGASGYDSEGLPSGMKVDNQLFQDEEPFTPVVETKDIPKHGDLVFQEKVEARNLQLRTIVYEAPYWLNGIMPYYETADKQSSPALRVMSEDGNQENMSSMPWFHVSRNFVPYMNLATGEQATGSYNNLITGPDGRAFSALRFLAADTGISSPTPGFANITGDFSVYFWIDTMLLAELPIQVCALQNLSIEIHGFGAIFQLLVNHNGTTLTENLQFTGNGWTMITVTRSGLTLSAYENKTYLGNLALPLAVGQGNTVFFVNGANMSLFDPCIVPRAVSLNDITYYYDNIIRGGDEVLQPF